MIRRATRPPTRAGVRALAATATAVLLTALLPASLQSAEAAPKPKPPGGTCDKQSNNTYQKLLACMTAEGVMKHERALQAIADANDDQYYPGSRAAGTEGYSESVAYVKRTMEAAGWNVTLDPVDVEYFVPPILRQLTPVQADYETGVFTGSGFASVEGTVIPVDINLTGDRASTSGCQASDFAGLDFSGDSDIALIQRGSCGFANKSRNAEDAGAEAVVIFNQGNTPDREELIVGNAVQPRRRHSGRRPPAHRPQQPDHPGRRSQLRRRRCPRPARLHRVRRGARARDPGGLQRHRREARRERRQRRHGRRPPRLRRGRSRHQRQRIRVLRPARARAEDAQGRQRQHPPASPGGPARSRVWSGRPTTSRACRRPSRTGSRRT